MTSAERDGIATLIEEHAEAVIVHTEEAHGALEFVDENREKGVDGYRADDIALKLAGVHAVLAIGLRLEILILTADLIPSDGIEVEVGGPS